MKNGKKGKDYHRFYNILLSGADIMYKSSFIYYLKVKNPYSQTFSNKRNETGEMCTIVYTYFT